jgi:large subunit ribosomal protein L9
MKIILLEKIEKLGQLGDIVNVKTGYARNFLLPAEKALRATDENLKYFESKAVEIRKKNDKDMANASKLSEGIDEKTFIVIRQAGENGQLFGSVTTRDIANILSENGLASITRNQVSLIEPIKSLGIINVRINLHPEVSVIIKLNIARTSEEAELQEKGLLDSVLVEVSEEESVVDVFEEGTDVNIEKEADQVLASENKSEEILDEKKEEEIVKTEEK